MIHYYSFALMIGYLLGSIPVGYLVGKAYGVNVLTRGSHSIGATNVKRTVGKMAGNFVFLLDALKGFLATYWFHFFLPSGSALQNLAILGLFGAILGHSFSIFLKFRGGKGIAVTIGGLIALMPNVLFIGIITWLTVFYGTKFVSLSSLCFGAILPLCSYLFGYSLAVNIFTIFLSGFIIVRHLPNIRRLLQGTEYRFGQAPSIDPRKRSASIQQYPENEEHHGLIPSKKNLPPAEENH